MRLKLGLTPKQKREFKEAPILVLGAVALVVIVVAFADRADRWAAEDAVEKVSGDEDVVWVVDIWRNRRGRRGPVTTLWCGKVDRIDGLVAVMTRTGEWPLVPMSRVVEVASEWAEAKTPKEASMLQDCVERLR